MTITETDLAKARTAWGDGLIAISKAYDESGIEGARAIAGALGTPPSAESRRARALSRLRTL